MIYEVLRRQGDAEHAFIKVLFVLMPMISTSREGDGRKLTGEKSLYNLRTFRLPYGGIFYESRANLDGSYNTVHWH